MSNRQNPRYAAAMLLRVVAANGRCDVRPIDQVPKSAQEIELERFLHDGFAPQPSSRRRAVSLRA
ncbi:hypothetical protein FBZ82_1311 [Azospirillum brasilense]|uniref:Uncharacterized protein n=1 Tax=Azospirillum brasilense TaxID=192 RepID=A0A560AE03_AZOBR|nr:MULTISPECIES: hypothetical protein [Azospirillum]MBB3268788.1 hypothetical protein [Azospirillum sp. OGB3]MBK3734125.1 hypothetical protein [Azospirillum brasilense]TWA58601.1 hypothetical protein FBZ82_1311 [Azospirillum brasilense]UKJ77889.1 hypothetical protein H1Q64_30190 [Azospirillum brasilense]